MITGLIAIAIIAIAGLGYIMYEVSKKKRQEAMTRPRSA